MNNIEERPGAVSRELERIASDTIPIYDENGAIEPDFLGNVTAAIEAGDQGLGRHARRTPARSRPWLARCFTRTGSAPETRRNDGCGVRFRRADRDGRSYPRRDPRRAAERDRRRRRPRTRKRRCRQHPGRSRTGRSGRNPGGAATRPTGSSCNARSIIRSIPPDA